MFLGIQACKKNVYGKLEIFLGIRRKSIALSNNNKTSRVTHDTG